MKRIALLVLGLSLVSSAAWAQAPTADFETALIPAPANLKEAATVIKWKPDYTYDTLKKGTNTLVCFDRTNLALPGAPAIDAECTSLSNLPRVAQNLKFEAEPDRAKRQAALDAAEKDGSRVKPEYGSVWYHARGADKNNVRRHTTVAVPGATAASTGIPDNPKQGGIWIMDAGTSTAHLMIPGF
jgi:hypothetical protein